MKRGYRGRVVVTNGNYFPVSIAAMWGELTRDDVNAMGRHYRLMHERNHRFASFVDSRHSFVPSAPMRRALADMSNEFEQASKKNGVCVTVVIDSKVLIGVLTAVRWFVKPAVELRYFNTAIASVAHIGQRFAAEGIAMAPGTAEFLARLDTATEDMLPSFSDGRSE